VLIQEGHVFGNFQVLSRLGSGGMGSVYLAENPAIGKRVALKVIHPDLARHGEVVQRFMNEARAVNRIGNEHIVEVHDHGKTPSGEYFFFMEYIPGRTLNDVIAEQGALPVPRALHVSAQLADALAAAHAVSIIHRDLKPDNVMLTTRLGDPDFVKVLDFGLAKMMAESTDTNLTAQGVVLGTPHYMAPEVCESRKAIDHRADIYSLGVLMFQMMTGRLPFDAPSMGGVLIKHVTEPPPAPRGINPAIPPSVEQVILRCLAKPPEARFQSMGELRQALLDPERYLAGGPPVMPAASPHRFAGAAPAEIPDTQISMPPVMPHNLPPQMQWPVAPVNRTMPIGAPTGIQEAVRRRWPIIAVVLGAAGLAGAAVVLAVTEEPTTLAPVIALAPANVLGDAGVAEHHQPRDAAAVQAQPVASADAAATVTVRLTTRPAGAQVFDANDTLLGVTPTAITLPRDGHEHVLVFRHPRAEARRKTVVASGDTEFELELTPLDDSAPDTRPRQMPDKSRPGRNQPGASPGGPATSPRPRPKPSKAPGRGAIDI
jgi:tRNA A-37 threonylcarbamoyl transferase component Bud32